MLLSNDQTLSRLAYRKLPLLPDYRIINSTYLFGEGTIPYIKHKPYGNRLKERILHSDGGAFLITGFRGVGKSTLIHNAVSELKIESGESKLLTATIVLSTEKTYSEILFEIIRRLYENLIESKIWRKISRQTRDRIKLAYVAT